MWRDDDGSGAGDEDELEAQRSDFDEEEIGCAAAKRPRISIDQFAYDEEEFDPGPVGAGPHGRPDKQNESGRPAGAAPTLSSSDQLVPYHVVPHRNPHAVRPEAAVKDSVEYYRQPSLWTLVYAHAAQGRRMPVFDEEAQRMVTRELMFDF